MSGRSRLRIATGVTNAGAAAQQQQRPGTASAQLTARLSNRSGTLNRSASTPALGRSQHSSSGRNRSARSNQIDAQDTTSPLPPLDAWGGVSARPSTTPGVFVSGRGETRSGRIFTPPRSSPGISRQQAVARGSEHESGSRLSGSPLLYPQTANNAIEASAMAEESPDAHHDGADVQPSGISVNANGSVASKESVGGGASGIPLGLHRMDREDLEVYVNMVRSSLAKQNSKDGQSSSVTGTHMQPTLHTAGSSVSELTGMTPATGQPPRRRGSNSATGTVAKGLSKGARRARRQRVHGSSTVQDNDRDSSADAYSGRESGRQEQQKRNQQHQRNSRRRKHRARSYHHHHHHHHHYPNQSNSQTRLKAEKGEPTVVSSSSQTLWTKKRSATLLGTDCGDSSTMGTNSDAGSWFARSKGSKTVPLRTLMLDPEVNNIPQVETQSDFKALIKAQNIPHPSYDIDGDGIVSQEDYALAKRFDINGDGVLDEAEKIVGRRIMTEAFLENHRGDLHLYGQGLAQKTVAENVDNISRSRGFKKIMSGLREKEKNLTNHGSVDVQDCVTLKPEKLTRHNFFNDKFDTTAWNDFTRDPREPGWLESRRHDGSRNQMYFMRKIEARESAQGKLNCSYRGEDAYSTRRITLITDPAVENC